MIITNFEDQIQAMSKTISVYELNLSEAIKVKDYRTASSLLVTIMELHTRIEVLKELT